jgi:hypothetical protein
MRIALVHAGIHTNRRMIEIDDEVSERIRRVVGAILHRRVRHRIIIRIVVGAEGRDERRVHRG